MRFSFSGAGGGGGFSDDEFETDWYPIVRTFQQRARQLEALGYRRTSAVFEKRSGFSQHQTGTAADFSISPAQVPEFKRRAQALGLQVVDEMDREAARLRGSRDWSGPHMHVQLFKAGRTPAGMVKAFPSD